MAGLDWLVSVGWNVAHGPDIALGMLGSERDNFGEVVLQSRPRATFDAFNLGLPITVLDGAFRKVIRPGDAMVQARNRVLHQMLVNGVTVEYSDNRGAVQGGQTRIIDFDDPVSNDLLAVNQFTATENNNTCRLDIVLFINGLPLVVIELYNPTDEDTTIWRAWKQLQTCNANCRRFSP